MPVVPVREFPKDGKTWLYPVVAIKIADIEMSNFFTEKGTANYHLFSFFQIMEGLII
jgi:hypothetical protein